jgi:ABC-type transporter Mla subunit MlaD
MNHSFEDQFKKFMAEWNQGLQQLKGYFDSGSQTAWETFEKQKDHFRSLLTGLKPQLEKAAGLSEENMQKLRAKLDELWLQLNLGKAEGRDEFHEQRKKIEAALHELQTEAKAVFGTGYDQLLHLFDANAQAFRTGMDILKLQYEMATTKPGDQQNHVKKELASRMQELQENLRNVQATGKENLETWNRMVEDGIRKMKDYFESFNKKS